MKLVAATRLWFRTNHLRNSGDINLIPKWGLLLILLILCLETRADDYLNYLII